MAVTRIADLAEYVAGRCRIYDAAFEADITRLRARHGTGPVIEALRLLEQHAANPDQGDRDGHKHAVLDGVAQTLTIFPRPRLP
jgi:hypothetical protein